MPESGGCMWQHSQDCKSSVLRCSIDKMVRKGEKSSAYFLIDLPDLGCYHVPGQAWVPLLNWGWLTQPGRVPLVDPFKDLLSPPFWLGPESCVASRPQGIWRQGSASLDLSWGWGSQLKPRSWEGSLLAPAPKHPQQCTAVLEDSPGRAVCVMLQGER